MCEVGQITPHSGAEITNSAHQKARQPQKTRVFAHKTVGTAFATAVEHNLLWELHKMKKTLLAVALASSLTSFGAVAADKAPEPDFSISGNFGLVNDYKYRGISQSGGNAAVSGGLDLTPKGERESRPFHRATLGCTIAATDLKKRP
ncbi:MAG: TorF family putative porin [Burkholderiaceae bacterium]